MELLNSTLKQIEPLYEDSVKEAVKRLDNLAKPIGSLGYLEDIASKMAGITGKVHNEIKKKNIIIMCADNGVVEEGVSACPQYITAILTNNATKGIMGVSVLSNFAKSDTTVVDIGVKADFNDLKIINKKIDYGTNNMLKGPAMTREQAIKAIETGIEIVDNLVKEGYDLLGTGELGIGNTTTSAAILSVLSDIDSDIIVGKGAGLTLEQYENKKRVVKKSIEVNKPDKDDVIDVISKVGGFDIAGLCGCFLGAAKNRVPIVIDGFISSAAALCAYKLNPISRDYMFPSHLSAEPGAVYMMKELNLEPMLNLKMRLGEGSGCPLAFNIIEAALEIINKMGTFEDAMINSDFLVDIR
ncbi:nicotinate-nucleotide-dimethylbenzimidazole phosphoribosyltransferase [Caloramator quimbayensis]|uniref:Nicotinate-nucleotide--dimethylbenzimidazole phosphoribosyltransferase n=1 Tax=Caloramator quimbayensis TaxID=1147123 RepID=A0A1T4WZX9_9CLOT|nr:nicotinate-nucleotide--dimethylbenzimidazole phosphoribosyltransferase [Caloramator quimbayensis]SKA82900.1 nicotinate-nucleotide-dimethylbenzimidazole phosphoribosyltransferase [Caloramator quimbayensis]